MESKIIQALKWVGLGFFEPVIQLIKGKEVEKNIRLIIKKILIPVLSVFIFLGACNLGAKYLYGIERDRKIEKTGVDSKNQSSSAKKTNQSIIDWELSLKAANQKENLARDMLYMLVASFEETRTKTQRAIEEKNTNDLTQQVHKLHGATAYCGVPELKDIAYRYETHLKLDGITELTPKIQEQFIEAINRVESEARVLFEKT